MKKHSAFTLIELMVVMAIIAILATAGLSGYTGYIKKANDAKNITMLSELNAITEMFRDGKGELPNNIEDLVTQYYNSGGGLADIGRTPSLAWIQEVLGIPSVFAIPNPSNTDEILVAGGKTGCAYWDGAEIAYDGPCAVYFLRFTDDSHAWGVGVRTAAFVKSSFQLDDNGNNYAPPETNSTVITPLVVFRGNNKALNTYNPTTLAEGEEPVKVTRALTIVYGIAPTFTISIKSGIDTNSLPQPPPTTNNSASSDSPTNTDTPTTTADCSSVGQVCSDGTVYVSAGLRTTVSNEGSMSQSAAITYCQNKGSGWRLPSISELTIICNNQALIGNFPRNASGYFSSTTWTNNPAYAHITGFSSTNLCSTTGGDKTASRLIRCIKDV